MAVKKESLSAMCFLVLAVVVFASPSAQAKGLTAATLQGSVQLHRRGPLPRMHRWSIPLTIVLWSNGQIASVIQKRTDEQGRFTIEALPLGTFDIQVKGSHSLSNRRNALNLVGGLNTCDLGLLLEGDANNDDVVDITDFSLLRANFGTTDPHTDYNDSGMVDILDFSLLRATFARPALECLRLI